MFFKLVVYRESEIVGTQENRSNLTITLLRGDMRDDRFPLSTINNLIFKTIEALMIFI